MAWMTNAKMAERVLPAFKARGQSITYREKSDSTNRQTGVVTASNTDTVIGAGTNADPGALTSELEHEFIQKSGGKYKFGDREFKIRDEDLPETYPKKGNEIIFGGATFVIRDYARSQCGNIWVVLGNRL